MFGGAMIERRTYIIDEQSYAPVRQGNDYVVLFQSVESR